MVTLEHSLVEVLGGAVMVGRPVAQALDDGTCWEVTRLACTGAPSAKMVASKLLAAAADASFTRGILRLVSYTRTDEDGHCYKAAGWIPVAGVKGRKWDEHNTRDRAQEWLPGIHSPTTEVIDRVRWEKRPTEAIMAVVKMIAALGRFSRAWSERRARCAA